MGGACCRVQPSRHCPGGPDREARAGLYGPHHNGVRANADIVTNPDPAKNLGAGAREEVIANRGPPLVSTKLTDDVSLYERAVVADHGRPTDDHAVRMQNREALADGRAGGNLCSRKDRVPVTHQESQAPQMMLLQPVTDPVQEDGVEPQIRTQCDDPMRSTFLDAQYTLSLIHI